MSKKYSFQDYKNLNVTTKIYCRCIITGNLYESTIPTRDLKKNSISKISENDMNLIKLGISPEGWKWWKKKCKL